MLKLAQQLLKFSLYLFVAVFLTAFVSIFVNVASAKTLFINVINWLIDSKVLLIAFGVVIATIVTSGIIVLWANTKETFRAADRALYGYLEKVIEQNASASTEGFSQRLGSSSPISVPLQEVYYPLPLIPDFPMNDVPQTQRYLLDLLAKNTSPSLNEEDRLAFTRYLQVSRYVPNLVATNRNRAKERVTVEELVKQLNATNPTAAILGMPGSGKTMIIRWLTLQMAQASLHAKYPNHMALIKTWLKSTRPARLLRTRIKKRRLANPLIALNYQLPSPLSPAQIPLLIYVKEYVSFLSERKRANSEKLSLKDFLEYQLAKELPLLRALPAKLLQELSSGHCFVLFDGTDEIPDDALQKEVLSNISAFIATYKSPEKSAPFNRFILNSRIFGYIPLDFVNLHYTLAELDRPQIELGLKKWCNAVHKARAGINRNRPLNPDEVQEEWRDTSAVKYHELMAAIDRSPSLEQLAANPLMLTGIVLIHFNGQMLPQRRIELYNTMTESLLHTWNLKRGPNPPFAGPGALREAEQVLGDLAYYLHTQKPVLTKSDVVSIARAALNNFRQSQNVSEDDALTFIDSIRESSGLFVESGVELYSFMHRTFQEYYVARYLQRDPDTLKAIVLSYYLIPRWREPLLLAVASLVLDLDLQTKNREQASALIEAVMHANDPYGETLHRGLLFATSCIIDCGISAINHQTQEHVAKQLFSIYGDMIGTGRYGQLREEIERLALLWLGTQSQSDTPTSMHMLPHLLKIWREALANTFGIRCQQGAVQLLAAIATKMRYRASQVRYALIPPLIQLAKLHHLPTPIELEGYFPRPPISTNFPHMEADAYIALRSLDAAGPAGWLYAEWLSTCKQKPEFLNPLTSYAIELDYLLTPAAFPAADDSANWQKLLALGEKWQKRHQLGSDEQLQKEYAQLQKELLNFSNVARYPLAHLIRAFLERVEQNPSLTTANDQWISVWDALLAKEMEEGRSATFYSCFLLRLLLCRRDQAKRRQMRDVLLKALRPALQQNEPAPQQYQAFMLIAYIYLIDLLNLRNLLEHLKAHDLADVLKQRQKLHAQDQAVIKDMHYQQNRLEQLFFHDRLGTPIVRYLHNNLDLLDLGDIIALRELDQPTTTQQAHINIKTLLAMREIRSVRNLDEMREIQLLLDPESIINLLCNALEQPGPVHFYLLALLALHSVLTREGQVSSHSSLRAKTLASVHLFEAAHPSATDEPFVHELTMLLKAIKHLLSPGQNGSGPGVFVDPVRNEDADTRARYLQNLCTPAISTSTGCALKAEALHEIISSCTDTRTLSDALQQQIEAATVQQVALKLLPQQYEIDKSTFAIAIQFLNNTYDATIRASAALFLQFNKAPALEMSKEIAQKVQNSLTNDEPSYRPLYILGNHSPRYLDDILFDTLRIVAEHIAEQEIETKLLQKATT